MLRVTGRRRIGPVICYLGVIPGLAMLFAALPVHAQQFRGDLSGTVVDQQQRPVPGAKVTLTSKDTNASRSFTTDDTGVYRFAALEPGLYAIEVVKSGFQSATTDNVQIFPSQEKTANLILTLNGVATAVAVYGAPEIEPQRNSPTVEMILPGSTLDEIPIGVTRDYSRAALFAALVSRGPGQNEFAVNGARGRSFLTTADGADNKDNTVTLPGALIPPEGIKEFQIQTSNYSAVYGGTSGARINVITKSGTNTIHGEAWDFYRSSLLEPLSLVNRRAGIQKCSDVAAGVTCGTPRFVNNQFGIDAGGPIIRNKTFIFGIFQANLRRGAPTALSSATIPTVAGLAALQTVRLRDGQSQASRDAMLQALRFLPAVQAGIRSYTNVSTVTVNSIPIEVGTFVPLIAQPQNFYYSSVRIDHQVSQTDPISYRFLTDFRNQPLAAGNLAFGPMWGADQVVHAQNHYISYTKHISSHVVNEARVAYERRKPDFVERDPVSSTVALMGLFTIGGSSAFPQRRVDQTYQFQDVVSYTPGRHSLKVGLDLRKNSLFNRLGTNSKGTWTFSSLENFMNNTADSLVQAVAEAQTFTAHELSQAYFVQDDFKATPRLTINAGLRYETNSIPFGMFGATDPAIRALGVPGPLKRDTNNWGPKIGFAYSLGRSSKELGSLPGYGRTVLRAGVGVSYDVLFYNILTNTSLSYPRSLNQPDSQVVDLFPTLTPRTATIPPVDAKTSVFVNIPVDSQNPMAVNWGLSMQRQLGQSSLLEVGYSASRYTHGIRQGQANPGITSSAKAAAVLVACAMPGASSATCVNPGEFASSPDRLNPNWGSRQTIETTGEGHYQALYIQFDQKLAHGLGFGGNYTYSATFSNSDDAFNDNSTTMPNNIASSTPQVPQDFLNPDRDSSRSVFDRPHRLSFHYQYAIPWFSDSPKILTYVMGGWQISGFSEFQSGQPFTIRIGVDAMGNGSIFGARPDLNPGGILIPDPVTHNLRTFTIPLDGTGIVTAPHITDPVTGAITFLANSMPTGGTLGRNTFRGPGFQNWNLSLMRKIPLVGQRTLEIRGDFINLFNHDNFLNPDAIMSSVNFGRATGPNTAGLITDARQVLLGAKIRF